MGITSLVLEKFGLITGAGLDGTLLTMLARDGEVFFVLLRASSLVLPEERPGKSSAPPFVFHRGKIRLNFLFPLELVYLLILPFSLRQVLFNLGNDYIWCV